MPLHLCKSRYDFIELMYEGTTNISYTDYANLYHLQVLSLNEVHYTRIGVKSIIDCLRGRNHSLEIKP